MQSDSGINLIEIDVLRAGSGRRDLRSASRIYRLQDRDSTQGPSWAKACSTEVRQGLLSLGLKSMLAKARHACTQASISLAHFLGDLIGKQNKDGFNCKLKSAATKSITRLSPQRKGGGSVPFFLCRFSFF